MFLDVLSKKQTFISQSNIFYNYTLGFETPSLDLLKTAGKLLKSGLTRCVCFSDFKYLYLDNNDQIKYDKINLDGRNWDSSWKINFEKNLSSELFTELFLSCELLFHENRIVHENKIYIRASLPPFVLEENNDQITIYPGVKIYLDGVAILYFQYDGEWSGLDEDQFLSLFINLNQRYFDKIWVDAKLQKLDGEVALKNSFDDVFSIGGNYFEGKKIKKLKEKMREDSRSLLKNSLEKKGRSFLFDEDSEWVLHQIAGTEEDDGNESWESSIETCRSIYSNAISCILVPKNSSDKDKSYDYIWQGRPSVSLLRFSKQPCEKSILLKNHHTTLIKLLNRANVDMGKYTLPEDLRKFGDYCLHANRSIYLWTWLRKEDEPENVWEHENAYSKVLENQARTEQVEYHNMVIARACSWASNPPSSQHLFDAYTMLAETENNIYHSSISGEISDALKYIIEHFGTAGLIAPAKEMARFRLDELKYRSDSVRNKSNYWLTFVFGLVGVTSFAEFVVNPLILDEWKGVSKVISPFLSFGASTVLILLISGLIWYLSKKRD